MARENGDSSAIIKIIEPEGTFAVGYDSEIGAGDAKVVIAGRIHVEGSRALAENQTSNAGAVFQGKIIKFENGVGVEKSGGAIFKFDFGTPIVGCQNVALADRQIGFRPFPDSFLIRQWIAVGLSGEADITLNETEANDTGMAGIGGRGLDSCRKNEEQRGRKKRDKRGAVCHVSPPWGTLAELLTCKTDGKQDRLRPCDAVAMVSPGAAPVKGGMEILLPGECGRRRGNAH